MIRRAGLDGSSFPSFGRPSEFCLEAAARELGRVALVRQPSIR